MSRVGQAGSPPAGATEGQHQAETLTVTSIPRWPESPGATDSRGGVRSVATALDALECFAAEGALGVSDVARRLGIAKSTAHRLMQTLRSREFIEQDADSGLYRLGIHLYELGHLAQARNALRHAALPHLKQISAASGYTLNLAVPSGADVVFVERIETGESGRLLGHVGRRIPLHATSSGKVIAAFNPAVDQARRAAGFPPFARPTIRNETTWTTVLADVRRQGFAVSHGESFTGMSSIALPVLQRGVAVASISAFGPTALLADDIVRLRGVLERATREIATHL